MPPLPRKTFRQAVTRHARTASLAALLPLMGSVAFTSPAKAAPPTCQAIDASSILSSTTPSGGCSQAINPGDTFSIDFTNVFNPTDFALDNTYSLQVANIGTGTLDFEDVQLEITGAFSNSSGSGNFSTLTPISIWTDSGSFGPTGQGLTNYIPSVSGGPFFPGGPTAYKKAAFSLTSPVTGWPPFGVPAGLINTFALKLSDVGVTSFTSARITGLLKSTSSPGAFSAGLGIFTTNNPATQSPNLIYGNAFNVPGPLPIVGAGAAFGWSRRLRRRVKKGSAAASVA